MTSKLQLRSVRSLPEGPPLLVGRLAIRRVRSGPDKGRPFPVVLVHSPWSRQQIEIHVPGETMGLEATFPHYLADCEQAVAIGLDPANLASDRKTLAELKAATRRWAVQEALARGVPVDRLAAERTLHGVA